MLQYLPNCLTISRVLLAVPLGFLILGENYPWALAVGFVAGLTDALDGYFARRLEPPYEDSLLSRGHSSVARHDN